MSGELEVYDPGASVSVLGDAHLEAVRQLGVHRVAVQEDDDVGVLLDGTGLAEVGCLLYTSDAADDTR